MTAGIQKYESDSEAKGRLWSSDEFLGYCVRGLVRPQLIHEQPLGWSAELGALLLAGFVFGVLSRLPAPGHWSETCLTFEGFGKTTLIAVS